MSKIHYFQRYSQRENVVTNNTLLLFSRLYNDSPLRFEDFINSLFADDGLAVDVGVRFRQQEGNKTGSSTPDGSMVQTSLKVLIETKLFDNQDSNQLLRHLDGFAGEDSQILMLINPSEPSKAFDQKVHSYVTECNQKKDKNVRYASTTFSQIISALEDVLFEYDVELREILEDFREFCSGTGLIPRHQYMMRAIVAGDSFDDNMKYGVYFDPVERGFSPHHYLGLYRNKSVRAVGVLTKIVRANFDSATERLTKITFLKGEELTDDEESRIINIMHDAEAHYGWNTYQNHQFFLVDKFHETNYKKTTKYPIQRTKFFDLGRVLEKEILPECNDIASLLAEQAWD